jgi:BRCT domain type II-containing protein
MGPAKEEKANKLGIKMINEDEFLELINWQTDEYYN